MEARKTRTYRVMLTITLTLVPIVGMAACNTVLKVGDLKVGECLPDERSCLDNAPRICNGDGYWQTSPRCAEATCQESGCVGVCEVGKQRCMGAIPQACDADGSWIGSTPCGANEQCQGGVCKQICIPGDLRCMGNQPQHCAETGTWADEGMAPCDQCYGCDEVSGTCATKPKNAGDECDDDNACTFLSVCNDKGECKPVDGYSVECIAQSDCSASQCDAQSGSCEGPDGTTCDDRDVCTGQSMCTGGICTSPGGDRSFAHWNMASPPTPPGERFHVLAYASGHEADELVYDTWTHLFWQRRWNDPSLHLPLKRFEDAKSYCETEFKPPGYPSGWRLPSRIELASILDYETATEPAIDTTIFPEAQETADNVRTFWTSSERANDAKKIWKISFREGLVLPTDKGQYWNYRCVR